MPAPGYTHCVPGSGRAPSLAGSSQEVAAPIKEPQPPSATWSGLTGGSMGSVGMDGF